MCVEFVKHTRAIVTRNLNCQVALPGHKSPCLTSRRPLPGSLMQVIESIMQKVGAHLFVSSRIAKMSGTLHADVMFHFVSCPSAPKQCLPHIKQHEKKRQQPGDQGTNGRRLLRVDRANKSRTAPNSVVHVFPSGGDPTHHVPANQFPNNQI